MHRTKEFNERLTILRLFLGYDQREAVGFHVCVESIIQRTKFPVSITPIYGSQRDGTNKFTYARFLVPKLCNYEGLALFIDGSDMLVLSDLSNLFKCIDLTKAVSVVKQVYQTKHPRKYLGTLMEAPNQDYPRKNWSSVMLFNCSHPANRKLTEDYVRDNSGPHLHRLGWLSDELIGELPKSWNVLIGEDDEGFCNLAHYTLGIPAFENYKDSKYSEEWFGVKEIFT